MKLNFTNQIMRRCLIFGVVLILTLTTFPMYAFANDEPVVSPTTTGDSDFDSELRSLATTLYSIETSGGTKAASRTIDDIYNLLVQIFYNQSNGSNEIVVMRQFLNTINTSANAIVVKLTQFYDSINPDYDQTGISIYDELHAVVTALTTIDPNDGDLTMIETLVYITTALDDLHTDLTAILNSTYSIDNKLVNINTAILQFKSDLLSSISTLNTDINTGFTNVNANMALILSRLLDFQNSFNNIQWNYISNPNLYHSGNVLVINNSYSVDSNPYYLYLPNHYSSNNSIYKIIYHISFSDYSYRYKPINDLYLKVYGNIISPNYYLEYDVANSAIVVYLFDFPSYSAYTLNVIFNSSFSYLSLPEIYYIDSTNIDYFNVYNYLTNKKVVDTSNIWRQLYASDDLIAAKEDQQDYEDDAIEDFTGSGSAAASRGDLSNIKDVSTTIKQGLQSGGSVSNALAPFNSNSGFWGWFSQNNYDNINNIPSSGLRGGHNNEPEIIDFYNNNQITLHGLLGGSN